MFIAILVLAAFISVVVLLRQRRLGVMVWDWGSTLIFAVGWLYLLPNMASKLTNSGTYGRDALGELEQVDRGWAERLVPFADIAALGLAAVIIVLMAKRGPLQWKPVTLPLTLIILMGATIAAFEGTGKPSNQSMLLFMLIIAAGLIQTSIRAVATSASVLVLSVALMSTVVAIVNYGSAVQECTVKCSEVGVIFSGGTPHGNSLGLIMTLGLPFIYLIFNGKARIWMSTYALFIITASGSRTSLAVAVITMLVLVACKPQLTARGLYCRWPWAAVVAAFAAGITASVVPLTQTDPLFATGRGYLWDLAKEHIAERPIMGWGNEIWNDLYKAGRFGDAAAYSTHNQMLEILLMTGLVGMLLFVIAAFIMLGAGEVATRLPAAVTLLTIFSSGIFERSISISLVNPMTWALLALILVSNPANATRPQLWKSRRSTLPDWASGGSTFGSSFR